MIIIIDVCRQAEFINNARPAFAPSGASVWLFGRISGKCAQTKTGPHANAGLLIWIRRIVLERYDDVDRRREGRVVDARAAVADIERMRAIQ